MDFCAAQSHKDVFLQLAVGASARGRRARVALIYDELVRRKWSDKSLSGDARLDIAQVAGVVDEAAFRQAEADFDARVRQPKCKPTSRGGVMRIKARIAKKAGASGATSAAIENKTRRRMRNPRSGSAIDRRLGQWP